MTADSRPSPSIPPPSFPLQEPLPADRFRLQAIMAIDHPAAAPFFGRLESRFIRLIAAPSIPQCASAMAENWT